ncbi:MAG TPA: nucleotide exchange factor GrpE [Anaerolineae bacterium]|nr:nucleotide exchange factor GrpE [Anaerolineae bacterium]
MKDANSREAELTVDTADTPSVSTDENVTPPAEAASAPGSAAAAVDGQLSELAARLAEAEQSAAEYLDSFQRSQAAFANFRKRMEAEQSTMRKVANAALLTRLLPVMDDFRRAFQALPTDLRGNAWIEGIALIQRKVAALLEIEDVKPIVVKPGDSFDPLFHQAILHQELAGYTEGQIITEVEQGYILGDRVLRPSMVVVAKSPAPPVEPTVIPDETEEMAESEEATVAEAPTESVNPTETEGQNG